MSHILDFLEAVHPPRLRGSDYIELRAFKQGKERREFFTNTQQAEEWATALYQEFNVYVGVCPRPTRAGRNEDIRRSYYLWADVDADKVMRKGNPLENMIMSKMVLVPTIIVKSGSGGLHLYWEIEDCTDLQRVQAVNNAIAERIHEKCDKLGDPARILRIAGTLNHKSVPPMPVELKHHVPGLRYKIEDMEAALRLNEDVSRRVHSGSSDGYNSRSERDYAVVAALVRSGMSDAAIQTVYETRRISDKADESPGGHYLTFTLAKVRAEEGLTDGEVSPVHSVSKWGIIEKGNCYYAPTADGSLRQLSTFVFDPEVLLEGDINAPDTLMGSIFVGGDDRWDNIALSRRAFSRTDTLINALPKAQWQWFGKDPDVRKLLPYMIDRLIEKGDGKIPVRKAVSSLGRYGDVIVMPSQTLSEQGVLDRNSADTVWLPTGREHPHIAVTEYSDDEIYEALNTFCQLYPLINETAVTYPALGWFVAALFKPLLEAIGVKFPVLNLFGTRGSGKTTLITAVLQPLVGYVEPKTYDANTTNFVMLSLLGSSNSFPVAFSEYRKSSLRNPESLVRYILLAYDSGSDSRGRSDQTTVEYPLCAPFTVDGEDAISDPACLERTIQLNMHPEAIREDMPAYDYFQQIQEVNFEAIAYGLLKWSLNHEPAFAQALNTVRTSFASSLPDRVRRNLAVVVTGLQAFQQFAYESGIDFEVPNVRTLLEPVLRSVVNEHTGRTRLMVDDMIEDVINHLQTTVRDDFIYHYEQETRTLYLHVTSAHKWWLTRRRSQNLPTLDSAAIKNQLRERLVDENSVPHAGNYVTFIGTKTIGGSSTHVYAINMGAARATGLDVADDINRFKPVLRTTSKVDTELEKPK